MNHELINNCLRRDVVDTKQQANALHEHVKKSLLYFTDNSKIFFQSKKKILLSNEKRNTKKNKKRKQNITLQNLPNT